MNTGGISTDAKRVVGLDYASMGERRLAVSHVEAKPCVNMGNSGTYVGCVKDAHSALENVQIMADKRFAVQDVEVASSARIVFL